jgi:NAD-dependent dihydropyrimidine dehydrogenase PreA subunit
MIELISEERCIACNKCVQVCPMNVFSGVKGGLPVIARQADCQTCFMCELYCPVDALYVAPDAEQITLVSEEVVEAKGLFGSYRTASWVAQSADALPDQSFRLTEPR